MAKVWVLDTETKGTGAQMVPLEKVQEKPAPQRASRTRRPEASPPAKPRTAKRRERKSAPLPAGHVRKKATGEIGKVKAVDARAGTATVTWLKQGRTSTVPLAGLSRR
jgi:hypothetical protein